MQQPFVPFLLHGRYHQEPVTEELDICYKTVFFHTFFMKTRKRSGNQVENVPHHLGDSPGVAHLDVQLGIDKVNRHRRRFIHRKQVPQPFFNQSDGMNADLIFKRIEASDFSFHRNGEHLPLFLPSNGKADMVG